MLMAFERNVDVADGGLVVSFELNDCPLGSAADVASSRRLRAHPQLSDSETVEYYLPVPPECLLMPTGPVDPAVPVEIDQTIEIFNPTGAPFQLDYLGLSFGSLPNIVPEPGAAAQAVAALATLVALRRRRRRPI